MVCSKGKRTIAGFIWGEALTDYKNFSDEELIDCIREGNENVIDYLMDKYKNLVRKKAQTMFILGADNEDLIQEGMIGLFKAIQNYDHGRDASFFTFAELCISRQIYTAIQASGRKKHMPLNSYISFYSNEIDEIQGTENVVVSTMEYSDKNTPEKLVIEQENLDRIERIIEKELSEFEKQVLELHITGMGYVEIAKILGKEAKSVDNALSRLKMKLKKALNKK